MLRSVAPKVLTGHHLLEGDVIYLSLNEEWTREIHKALIIDDEAAANSALEKAKKDSSNVVDPYLIEVVRDANGCPSPVHFRETYRSRGPSNYHHGKQAEHLDVQLQRV